MKKYSNVIFDLFDTLIIFNPKLLPKIEVNGKEHFSTGKDVYCKFSEFFNNFSMDEFYNHFLSSYRKFQELKNFDNREYPNRKRFEIMFDMMGINNVDSTILDELVISHMNSLSNSMIFPENYRSVIDKLKERGYELSILSNFDYSPIVYKLLELYDITSYFNYIFISVEIGWRKPSPHAFNFAIEKLNIRTSEAVFIGDDYDRDILGASGSNIDSILINLNKKNEQFNPALASVYEFEQILDILN